LEIVEGNCFIDADCKNGLVRFKNITMFGFCLLAVHWAKVILANFCIVAPEGQLVKAKQTTGTLPSLDECGGQIMVVMMSALPGLFC
jgi:hypothetical protein